MSDTSISIRLKHFLEYIGLSNSQFADLCGIPRPTLSQLLSGRNKKISDQILRPIHEKYPELSLVWLMFGEGDMLDRPLSNDKISNQIVGSQAVLSSKDDGVKEDNNETISSENNPFMNDDWFKNLNNQFDRVEESSDSGKEENNVGKESSGPQYRKDNSSTTPPRCVKSIVIYYDDNTYETFVPQN